VAAEFLYQQGLPPQATYRFKHALIQDAAYQSLLRSTRQRYHQRIAQVLEAQFPDVAKTQPELVAHHYTNAGLPAPAIPYWQRAGQQCLQRSAHTEAVQHLAQGLELLATLPETPARAQQELDLQMALGPALVATKGFAAPAVGHVYARARALCQQVGDTPQFFPALWGLWVFYNVRGELRTAQELGEHLLSLAQRASDPALLLQAHHALETTLFWSGEFTAALEHMEQGLALYNPQQHRSHAFLYGGHDPGVCCLSHGARALWYCGYPDRALRRSHEAFRLAQELSHPGSVAHALGFAAALHRLRREGQLALERSEAAIALARGQGFAQRLAEATMLRGWALAAQAQEAEGLAQMCQGLADYRATGGAQLAGILGLLAETYGKVGQPEAGLTVLAEALAHVDSTGERYHKAELHRLHGELWLALSMDHQSAAESCFQQSLDVARHQHAKSLELRAALSLSRLWQRQGKRAEAYDLLAPIYGWFAEGLDTPDLSDAKALLEELS
jgi:predicted ATPase